MDTTIETLVHSLHFFLFVFFTFYETFSLRTSILKSVGLFEGDFDKKKKSINQTIVDKTEIGPTFDICGLSNFKISVPM